MELKREPVLIASPMITSIVGAGTLSLGTGMPVLKPRQPVMCGLLATPSSLTSKPLKIASLTLIKGKRLKIRRQIIVRARLGRNPALGNKPAAPDPGAETHGQALTRCGKCAPIAIEKYIEERQRHANGGFP